MHQPSNGSSARLGLAAGITQKLKRPYQINRLENKLWVTALAAQSNPHLSDGLIYEFIFTVFASFF
jgi:hypothetical protein